MVFQPTIIVNQTGSSGIPAYDSLEEITSPSAGMVVKINGQEGGSGTPRGVLADDVLGVVAWATTPDNLTFVENTWTTLLTFSDGKKIETYREYVVDITDYANAVVFDNRTIYLTTDFGDYPEWNNATYDFGNRTVSAINDSSIQSVI
ncbi:hypothetical protein EOM57_05795, partial [Candidatus Saccharibacteria bacterium]|nr:hypothetical protein [Candidatus Saccharibacteria bacterium]